MLQVLHRTSLAVSPKCAISEKYCKLIYPKLALTEPKHSENPVDDIQHKRNLIFTNDNLWASIYFENPIAL